jgi:hypothetical protein
VRITKRLAPALPEIAAKQRSIFLDGYIACSSATVVFAVALVGCYSDMQTGTEATQALCNAIYATLATVLVVIAIMFELADGLHDRISAPVSVSVVVGLAAIAPVMSVMRLHPFVWLAAAVMFGLRMLRLLARNASWRRAIAPLLGGAAVGYWTFLLSFVDGYKTPWINEAALLGQVHVDLLFHSAIVNMLRSYGVGSIGVDGVLPFPYYFGSHRIVEALISILRVPPLEFYSVVFPLLLGPLFLAVFFFFAVSFQRYIVNDQRSNPDRPGGRSSLFWWLLVIVFIGVFPAQFRRQLGLFDNVFHSESFGIGMLFAYLPGILFFECTGCQSSTRLNGGWLVLGGGFLAGICALKLSVACVLAGAAAYLLLRLKVSWRHRVCGFAMIAAPLCYGIWTTRGSPSGDSGPGLTDMIKPFAFLRDLIEPRLWLYSFIAFFGPFILFALLRTFHRTVPLNRFWEDVKALKLIDLEVLTALLIVSVIPSMVLSIPQGATNFFSEVSFWFVLPMLTVMLFERLRLFGRPIRASHDSETADALPNEYVDRKGSTLITCE